MMPEETNPLGRGPDNLPLALTSFVGRDRETAEVETLLADSRLLTLTGPGGSGKTRLALAVAADVTRNIDDGVWLVELAPLSDPDLVSQAVASVLGVRETPGTKLADTLAEHLKTRSLLLVLDNCEHLLAACASLADILLRRCPNLRILATSRAPLGVVGEALFDVPPLSLPDPRRGPTVGSLPGYEAVRLFVERAGAVRPGFSLTEENAPAVAHVCYRLDGIPLALELAAARAKVLSVDQISERLDDSFSLLTGGGRTAIPHHKTLRAAMDWSYELLTNEEQTLLARLSVFAGGFALEAAEAVGTGGSIAGYEVLDLLASLVDKSLVLVSEQGTEARYRLLETVRQYGREKLEDSGEAESVRGRHAEFYLALAERADLMSREQAVWLERLETEHDNFRAALSLWGTGTLAEEDVRTGLRMAVALWPFWYTRGYLSEGRGWLEGAITESGPETSPAKAAALNGAGYIALFQGDYGAARAFLERSLALYRELRSDEGVASSLIYLGFVAVLSLQDLETLPALEKEALGLRPRLHDPLVVANLLLLSGLISINRGDLERAVSLHRESLAMFREMHDARGMGHCFNNLGFLALLRDDYEEATALLRENLLLARESGYKLAIQYSFLGLGFVAASRNEPVRAARLWGATEAMEEAFGIKVTPIARSAMNYATRVAAARSHAGETAFETAWSEGRAMTPEEAIDYALQEPRPPADAEPFPSYPSGLSTREVEVLRLVARGLTNAQVAEELYISPRTVNAHMGSIYHKIGSSTRAEAARFASENGLL